MGTPLLLIASKRESKREKGRGKKGKCASGKFPWKQHRFTRKKKGEKGRGRLLLSSSERKKKDKGQGKEKEKKARN